VENFKKEEEPTLKSVSNDTLCWFSLFDLTSIFVITIVVPSTWYYLVPGTVASTSPCLRPILARLMLIPAMLKVHSDLTCSRA